MASLLFFTLMAVLLSMNLVISGMSIPLEEHKNFFIPDPSAETPPRSYDPPRSPEKTTPSAPSKPPQNCGSPPRDSTTQPSAPSGGGGYFYSPPHDTTQVPSTPSNPSSEYYPSAAGGPPSIDPSNPNDPTITPPFLLDPNSPFIGTYNYWWTHPAAICSLLGLWETLGNAFGTTIGFPSFGSNVSLQKALSNKRSDGIGALYREGTASFLNSMLNHRFSQQIKYGRVLLQHWAQAKTQQPKPRFSSRLTRAESNPEPEQKELNISNSFAESVVLCTGVFSALVFYFSSRFVAC